MFHGSCLRTYESKLRACLRDFFCAAFAGLQADGDRNPNQRWHPERYQSINEHDHHCRAARNGEPAEDRRNCDLDDGNSARHEAGAAEEQRDAVAGEEKREMGMLPGCEKRISQAQEIERDEQQRADCRADPASAAQRVPCLRSTFGCLDKAHIVGDRKSTRLNSSHGSISYAVFCLKKKKKK